MIMNVYCIFDTKSLVYSVPWFQPTHGAAIRVLTDLVNDTNTNVGRHPADYVLYQVGTYDDGKAQLAPVSPIVHIHDAVALVNHVQPSLFNSSPTQRISPEAEEAFRQQMRNGSK